MDTPKKTQLITVTIPEDFALDEEEIGWIEHIIERAANRGASLEDTEAAYLHQEERRGRIDGANAVLESIRTTAGSKFADGDDTEANRLRTQAKQLEALVVGRLKNERAQHEELFILSYQRVVAERRGNG